MITRLAIQNFRAIQNFDEPLAKITLFIGENNTGKSSLLLPLELLKYWTSGPVTTSTPDFSSIEQIVGTFEMNIFKKEKNRRVTFAFEFEIDKENKEKLSRLANSCKKIYDNKKLDFSKLMYSVSLEYIPPPSKEIGIPEEFVCDGKKKTILKINRKIKFSEMNDQYVHAVQYYPVNETFIRLHDDYHNHLIAWQFNRVTYEIGLGGGGKPPYTDEELSIYTHFLNEVKRVCRNELRDKLHIITEVRKKISTYISTEKKPSNLDSEGRSFPWDSGENTLEILHDIYHRSREYLKSKILINKWLNKFQSSDLFVGLSLREKRILADINDTVLDTNVNLSNIGFGIQQLLHIMVQLASDKQQTIIIDEPEIHLHPKAQMELIDMFIDSINLGNQVICTTHSEHMFYRLQKRIAEGVISVNDVAVYHITKDENGTHAKRIKIEENGEIKGWLPSFFEASWTELNELNEKLSAWKNHG